MFNLANEAHFSLNVAGLEKTGLQVLSFEGKESISQTYTFEINLVNRHIRYDITQLLSKPAYLAFTPDGKSGVHGVIMSVRRGAVGNDYAEYSIILSPCFAHLEKRTNQRIFQHKTVPQIISQILSEYGILEGTHHEFRLKETYPERDYCVQYDETDAYFIQRLCEEEGIYYYFEHKSDNHLMVFGDSNPIFPSLAEAIRYVSNSGFVSEEPVIKAFDVNLTSKTKRTTWRDYNFTNTKIPEGQAEGQQSAKANGATEPDIEFYDYPGRFMDNARGKHLAQIEVERLRTEHVLAEGYSDVPILHTGYYITINEHPSLDATDPWLINTIIHQGKQPQVVEALGGENNAKLKNKFSLNSDFTFPDGEFNQGYRNIFTATPKDVAWRPPLLHPRTRIFGSQTAKVVGPAGEEIYCNEYGSVKVQFYWDREGQFDENSSCWVRVGSNWAHKGYGTFTIPRIGMEAVITFLEGDPDQPMITGCANNGINTQAEGMPANKTKTGFKTNSSPGGGGSNELTFEDKAGQEQIYIHAQKDANTLVENDQSETVKHDKSTTVLNNQSTAVSNEKTIVVGQGSGSSIAMDGENIVLQVGESKIVITAEQIFIHGKTHIHQTAAETINLDAPTDITLNCGSASPPPVVPFSDKARSGGK
ncbi:type VI secretion system tip protein TssI/VgrG [Entomomonas asaccharolytica]|uniref:Type VI secretion system tip protein VgrG n=1 Tax=Entomomonas asaccharolytica TaxID=2785331 RepID=A0A974NDR3_9GAMM|nr:type VI secretion system tip protein TssI/VgrG [Entomomonas asaccharolytica]QQP84808.1 type VI secretion system tip protein VgrG [Entomomonas asaccharolytica]